MPSTRRTRPTRPWPRPTARCRPGSTWPARRSARSRTGSRRRRRSKEDRLRPLRDKLLGSGRRFYDRLGELLRGQADAGSKAVLAESYAELGELIDGIGQKPEALEAYRKAVAIRRELAAAAGAGAAERIELARALERRWGRRPVELGDHAGALAAHEEARVAGRAAGGGAGGDDRGPPGAGHGPPRRRRSPRRRPASDGRALAALRRSRAGARGAGPRCGGRPRRPPRPRRHHGGDRRPAGKDRRHGRALAEQRKALESCPRPWPPSIPMSPDTAASWPSATTAIGGLLEADRRPGRGAGRVAEESGSCCGPWPPSTPPSPSTAATWPSATNRVGDLLEATGDLAGALAEFRAGARSCMRALAAEHPDVPDYRRDLAVSHNRVGAPAGAGPATWPGPWPSIGTSQESVAGPWPPSTPTCPDTAATWPSATTEVGGLLEETGDLAGALAEQRGSRS